jgi:deoxycytidylate deaminase
MTKKELAYFKVAGAMSETSDHPQYKIGAAVVLKHRVVSSGTNSDTKTHPLQKQYNKYRFAADSPHKCHAELIALLPLIKDNVDLSNASIFVYRKHKNHRLACARPCKSCMNLIKDVGIKRVFYTTEDGYAREDLKF